jgi:hypothetical protein
MRNVRAKRSQTLPYGIHVLYNSFFGNNHKDPAALAANDIDFRRSSDDNPWGR